MSRLTLEIVRDNVRAFVLDLRTRRRRARPFTPGDRLRVRGVLGGGYNYKDRLIERRVFRAVARLRHAPGRDAARRARCVTVDRLRAERGRAEFEGPVRVEGVVRPYTPGVSLVLASGDQQVNGLPWRTSRPLTIGESVEVIGFPGVQRRPGPGHRGRDADADPSTVAASRRRRCGSHRFGAVRDRDPAADGVRMPVRLRGQVVYRDPDADEVPMHLRARRHRRGLRLPAPTPPRARSSAIWSTLRARRPRPDRRSSSTPRRCV